MTSLAAKAENKLGWALLTGASVVLFFAFAAWAGLPPADKAVLFWGQLLILLLVIGGFALLIWHLLSRPLASGLRQPQRVDLPASLRQKIAFVVLGGGMALVSGAAWDELWHRLYGIPFGEDFFWRPHLLMYFGFITAISAGMWALLYLNRRLRGNMQQRFRANKLIALLILNAAFMTYGLLADPIWHWTYGDDLSAWSVPHLILLASIVATLTLAALLHSSTYDRSRWRLPTQLRFADALPIVAFAGILLIWLQLMLIDWDMLLAGVLPSSLGLYRPEWMLAGNLVAAVAFAGIVATRMLRLVGAATIAGLLALAIRWALIQLLDANIMHHAAWEAALLPLLAIDLYTFYRAVVKESEPEWRGLALALMAGMALNLVVIRGIYATDGDILSYALAVIVTAIGGSWFACQVARWTVSEGAAQSHVDAARVAIAPRLSFSILGAFIIFIFAFVTTATPPI